MLPFLRSNLAQLVAYTPHPGGVSGSPAQPSREDVPSDRLDTNENPYDLPDELKQKLAWIYQQEIEANRYPDGGHLPLKQAIAEYLIETASEPTLVTSDYLSIGNGSDELIRSLLIATCVGGEGSILVAEPTFSMYKILAQTLSIPVVTVERSPSTFAIDLEAARSAVAQTQSPPIRVVFVVHPNSPTGNPMIEAELAWIRSLPEQVLVVIDEAYFEFSQMTLLGELQTRSNWVILRTFSKAFRLAAHRVGYAIAHPELIAALEKVRLPYNLPATTQMAALWALTHRQTLLTVVPTLLDERKTLSQALSSHPALQVYPTAANFIFVQLQPAIAEAWNVSPEAALEKVFLALKTQGTLVRKINGGLRITVGSPIENQRTVARLQGILS
ncbi:MAG: histidinol-phosphate transaminase [Cyanobacteria bacterium CRU_2_1]|nr:histidinol-phosphate transaminase [Cyanobacteria bacterium RU_5_0]NJR59001.1 histidinol-phosphate transaminase [Cyanobacteria bacterium CRU_2_1]